MHTYTHAYTAADIPTYVPTICVRTYLPTYIDVSTYIATTHVFRTSITLLAARSRVQSFGTTRTSSCGQLLADLRLKADVGFLRPQTLHAMGLSPKPEVPAEICCPWVPALTAGLCHGRILIQFGTLGPLLNHAALLLLTLEGTCLCLLCSNLVVTHASGPALAESAVRSSALPAQSRPAWCQVTIISLVQLRYLMPRNANRPAARRQDMLLLCP